MNDCHKCGGPTWGYKCDVCGAEARRFGRHACGEDHLQPRCLVCGQAEVACPC